MNYYEQLVEKLMDSNIYMALVTDNFLKSNKCATEIGLAVLMDKPIVLAVKEGTKLPHNLLKLAEKVEYYKGPDDIKGIAEKLCRDIRDIKEKKA